MPVLVPLGEHGGVAPTPQKSEKAEARCEKATPLPSYAFHLPSCVLRLTFYAFHLPSSLLPLASCLLRLSSHLFPFYYEKRDVVCLCGGGSELEQVVYHGIDQGAGILMGVFFE